MLLVRGELFLFQNNSGKSSVFLRSGLRNDQPHVLACVS